MLLVRDVLNELFRVHKEDHLEPVMPAQPTPSKSTSGEGLKKQVRQGTHQLEGNHDDGLQGELAVADFKEIFEGGTEQFHD